MPFTFPPSRLRSLWVALAFAAAPCIPPGHALADPPSEPSRAREDYLRAITLAEEGSKPEALTLLAESLRLQPESNPAGALAFELLVELRTNGGLVLRGHGDSVLSAAYSPDGSKIVTASKDHTARIWDAHTGLPLGPVLQHGDDVRMAEFSPDGTRVVTASEDGTARVWDVATGQPVGQPMRGNEHEVRFARFSPDGTLVATGAEEGLAQVWDAATSERVGPGATFHGDVFAVNFSPDGRRIVVANAGGKAGMLDARTQKPVAESLPHGSNVFTAEFSPDGRRILTASADGTARLWDAGTGQPTGAVFRHGYWVASAAFNRDATRVATASWDHTARVWDAVSGQAITPPLRHADAVLGVSFSPDNARVATASRDGSARVWDAVSGDPLTLPLKAGGEVALSVFNPSGNALLLVSRSPTVQVRDLPPQAVPPAWLADLAEFASTQVRYDALRDPQFGKVRPLREQLLAANPAPGSSWARFGRWYFLESAERPISPWSSVGLQQYVEALIEQGDKDSLDYALTLTRDMPTLSLKITQLREKLGAPAAASPAKDED